eukprot:392392-Hanusia_phi.AAC.1
MMLSETSCTVSSDLHAQVSPTPPSLPLTRLLPPLLPFPFLSARLLELLLTFLVCSLPAPGIAAILLLEESEAQWAAAAAQPGQGRGWGCM